MLTPNKDAIIFENPAYRKWNFVEWEMRKKWIRSISIGDFAVFVDSQRSVIMGRIEMINNYGMDVNVNGQFKFVRFPEIKHVVKNE